MNMNYVNLNPKNKLSIYKSYGHITDIHCTEHIHVI